MDELGFSVIGLGMGRGRANEVCKTAGARLVITASLASILKARKKPIERIAFETLGVTLEARVQVLRLETPSSRRNCVQVDPVRT